MHFSVLILLVTLSAAVVSSKLQSVVKIINMKTFHRRQQGDMPPGAACPYGMYACAMGMIQKYQVEKGPIHVSGIAQRLGAREVCGDITDYTRCALNLLDGPSCSDIPAGYLGPIKEVFGLGDFLCVERLDDLEKNWKCLTTPAPTMEEEFERCRFVPRAKCDLDPIVDCIVDIIVDAPECNEEAGELVRETLMRIIPVVTAKCTEEDDDNYIDTVANALLEQLWMRK